ncbi:MAG: SPOR domain-containing protein [Gammaproteobacteria bacterium]
MSRDYRYHTPRKRRRKTKSSPWAWMAAGLAIGLFTTLLVFLKYRTPDHTAVPAALVPAKQEAREQRKPPPKAPITASKKQSGFDFYDKLPKMEIIIPEEEITGSRKNGVKQVTRPGLYLLQAGSFRSHEQAEKLRAKLAFQGMETRTQTSGEGNQQWHRVRVGPFNDLLALNKSRATLKKTGIDAIVIRLQQ